MNTILLFLNFLANSSSQFYLSDQDSCKVFVTPISKPFREIDNYKEYYNRFCTNDSSDYQVICISMPYDDSYGHLVYLKIDGKIGISEVGTNADLKKEALLTNKVLTIKQQLEIAETGGYGCICNMDTYPIVYSICVIKKRGEVIFQYQGLNKNILALSGNESDKLKNVIKLVKSLRNG